MSVPPSICNLDGKYTESGAPVENVQIQLTGTGNSASTVYDSTTTNDSGDFSFFAVSAGSYAVRAVKNGIYTGVKEFVVGNSCPGAVDIIADSVGQLPTTIYAAWNDALGMTNVAELSNGGQTALNMTYTMRGTDGTFVNGASFQIDPETKFDLLLNSNVPRVISGLVKFEVVGESAEFRCDVASYRSSAKVSKRQFDFAFSVPCQAPSSGRTAVLTNRVFPGVPVGKRSVSNWLTIANLSPDMHGFFVDSYSENGVLLGTDAAALNFENRYDFDLAKYKNITLAKIRPDDDTVPYLAILHRYDNGVTTQRIFAFGAHAQYGDGETKCVPVSNIAGSESYSELGNVNNSLTNVVGVVYASDGTLADSVAVDIPGNGVRHAEFGKLLPEGASGTLCLSGNSSGSLVMNQATYYFNSKGDLVTAFLSTPRRGGGVTSVFGSTNYFFNTYNWLRLMNLGDTSAAVEVQAEDDNVSATGNYLVGAHGRVDVPLHASPFTRVLDTYGRFRVNGSVAADLIRIIPQKNSSATGNALSSTVQ